MQITVRLFFEEAKQRSMPSDSCVAVQFPCFTLLTVTMGRHFCRRKCTDNFSSKIFSQRHMTAKTNRDKDLEALRHKVSDLEASMVRVNDRLNWMKWTIN